MEQERHLNHPNFMIARAASGGLDLKFVDASSGQNEAGTSPQEASVRAEHQEWLYEWRVDSPGIPETEIVPGDPFSLKRFPWAQHYSLAREHALRSLVRGRKCPSK
jgi:hypothetical protein